MATISTNSNIDSISYAAGDAHTVNAGVALTISRDCNTTGTASTTNYPYFGNVTLNGAILIDGAVLEIGVTSTSGASIGQTLTGSTSGATGLITQILASPARLKLRNWSITQFTNGETVTHSGYSSTIASAPTLSTIQFLINSGNTISSSNLSSAFQSIGCWKELGVSNGAASQTFTHFSPVAGGGVWVQGGSPITFVNGSATITAVGGHRLNNGQTLELATTNTIAPNFTTAIKYYVKNSDADTSHVVNVGSTFELALTPNGSSIVAGGTGTGTHSFLYRGETFTATNGSDTLTTPQVHSYAVDDTITFKSSNSPYTLPTPLNPWQTYWIVAVPSTLGIKVSLTKGGTPITMTSTGSGTHSILPDSVFSHYLNLVDRAFTTVAATLIYGRYCKQTAQSATITFGDGTNGRIPPVGAIIRVPNVLLGYTTSGTAPAPQISSPAGFDGTTPPRTCVFQNSQISRFAIASKNQSIVDIRNCAVYVDSSFTNALQFTINNSQFARESSSAGSQLCNVSGTNGLIIKRYSAIGEINNVGNLYLAVCSNFFLTDLHLVSTSGFPLFLSDYGSGSVVRAIWMSRSWRITGTVVSLVNLGYISSPTGGSSAGSPFDAQSGTVTIEAFKTVGTITGRFNNGTGGYSVFKISGLGAATASVSFAECLLYSFFKCAGSRFRNAFTSASNQFLSLSFDGANDQVLNAGTYNATFGTNYQDSLLKGIRASSLTYSLATAGTHWIDWFTSATVGRVDLLLCPTSSYYFSSNFYTQGGGSPSFTNANTISVQTLNQYVIYECPWFIKGHTAFTALSTITGTNVGNHLIEYQLDTGSGFGGYKTLSTTNLTGETINQTTGFRLKIRITCTTASATNEISLIQIQTTSTSAAQAALNYSFIDIVSIQLIGSPANAKALVQKLGDLSTLFSATADSLGAIAPFNYPYELDTAAISTRVRIRRPGYKLAELTDQSTASGQQTIIAPVVDLFSSVSSNYLTYITPTVVNNAVTTLTVNVTDSISGLYNSVINYLSNNLTVDEFQAYDGSSLTLSCNLTFASGITLTGTQTLRIPSGKTLTLSSTGTYSFNAEIASGATVVVPSGNTNFATFTFAAGSTINAASGTATVTVAESQIPNITAGSGVTLIQPIATLSAPNFAQGTRVQISRVETYIIPASAINTSTNTITIANHRFRSTGFPTLIGFQLATGATLPNTTPALKSPTLLYCVNVSGSTFQVSTTQGGTPTTFSTQGSGNFIIQGYTEIDNSLAGASGYSYSFIETNGTLLQVKARYYQNASGSTASSFFQRTYTWNSLNGLSIADTLSAAATPDTIYSLITSVAGITTADGSQIVPTRDGSTVAGLSFTADGIVSINDSDGLLLLQDAYAWAVYQSNTQSGIRLMNANNFIAQDLFNFQLTNVTLKNINSTTPLQIVGGYVRTSNASNPIDAASYSLQLNASEKGIAILTTAATSPFID